MWLPRRCAWPGTNCRSRPPSSSASTTASRRMTTPQTRPRTPLRARRKGSKMATRHARDFRAMNELELATELANHHQELFNLRFQLATRQLKNHQRVKAVRREIARVLTVARERELQALYD